MVASFDSFRHLTVTCILKTTSQYIMLGNIFDLLFNKESLWRVC
jgi:hypothetical protein